MLTQPDVPRLLARVAATLETTVQPDPATSYARQQVKAAVFALRDLEVRARIAPALLAADIADMRAILAAHGQAADDGDESGEAVTADVRHVRLQTALERLEGALWAALDHAATRASAQQGLRAVRGLHRRALAREAAARAAQGGGAASGE